MSNRVKLSIRLSAVLLAGTFFLIGSASSKESSSLGDSSVEGYTSIGAAGMGPLSGATFTIYDQKTNEELASGTTTVGDGFDVSTAGIIKVKTQTSELLKERLYRIDVQGGKDIDADDDGVWDAQPRENKGSISAVVDGEEMASILEDGKKVQVNIVTNIVYQKVKDQLDGGQTVEEIKEMLDDEAKELLDPENGDLNGDGVVDSKDLLNWNPTEEKAKEAEGGEEPALKLEVIEKVDEVIEAVHEGEEDKVEALSKKLLTKESEDIGNGNTIHFTLDQETGNVIKEEYKDADNSTYKIVEYTYDTNGKVKTKVEKDGNGAKIKTTEYTYDEEGRKIEEKIENHDDDTKEIARYTYYNADGTQVKELKIELFKDISDQVDSSYTLFFDEDGYPIRVEKDKTADGTVDRVYILTYQNGHPTLIKRYTGASTTILDATYTLTYNEGGYLTQIKRLNAGAQENAAEFIPVNHNENTLSMTNPTTGYTYNISGLDPTATSVVVRMIISSLSDKI